MMKHIFTLFLNQKRRYGGMLAEQMLVFFVLLFCFVVVGEKIAQYFSPVYVFGSCWYVVLFNWGCV